MSLREIESEVFTEKDTNLPLGIVDGCRRKQGVVEERDK